MLPVLCSGPLLAVPLRALFPEGDIRVRETAFTTPIHLRLMGPGGHVTRWPEEWHGRRVWLMLHEWGGEPVRQGGIDEAEIRRRAHSVLRGLGADVRHLQPLRYESVARGFKWVAIIEVG